MKHETKTRRLALLRLLKLKQGRRHILDRIFGVYEYRGLYDGWFVREQRIEG